MKTKIESFLVGRQRRSKKCFQNFGPFKKGHFLQQVLRYKDGDGDYVDKHTSVTRFDENSPLW